MTLSIRLDPELESELARAAAQTGRSKSELVKASLREYLARVAPRKSPYELGKDLFGSADAGPTDLAERRKDYLTESLRAKHDR
ncbi:MAG TPA: ribbon-helix-helix protein, CopG family [Thauera phenylacetica]|jgi:Arc/MetJ-type ribon-helix-helix transcriptional regulator|uniref:CopG family transcriptional regulator n=1 Tax=Thauera phenylacetica B4P TaxID=1234382 RepID=N6YQU9_9RHOO|nr:ribbon-helix-helix protein, CopG family [Thauera phenylacetica]ENO96681.1 CopG family transcriptional regulator [Thauera phenylacetica B4P]HRM71232.1 ribbon-helix-helix protein, CopG family [Thauera phenylacetica]